MGHGQSPLMGCIGEVAIVGQLILGGFIKPRVVCVAIHVVRFNAIAALLGGEVQAGFHDRHHIGRSHINPILPRPPREGVAEVRV